MVQSFKIIVKKIEESLFQIPSFTYRKNLKIKNKIGDQVRWIKLGRAEYTIGV